MRKFALGLIFSLIVMGVLYYGRPLLMPFVVAVAAWYLINTLADAFAKPIFKTAWALPRPAAFVAALVTITGAAYLAARIIDSNIRMVADRVPAYMHILDSRSRELLALIPWDGTLTVSGLLSSVNIGSVTSVVVNEVMNFLGIGAVVAVYLLFLFLEQKSFKGKLQKLLPDVERGNEVAVLLKRISYDIKMYLGIKTVASLATALLSYVIFKSVGLDFASFWAFIIFLFNYIPTVGSIVATALPSFFAFVQFPTLGPFLIVLIGVTSLQMLIGNILEPRFQGDRLNLSPVVILLSLALWNMIWGIPGMFLCVPLTSIVMIIFSYIPQTQKIAVVLSRNGDLSRTKDENLPAAVVESLSIDIAAEPVGQVNVAADDHDVKGDDVSGHLSDGGAK